MRLAIMKTATQHLAGYYRIYVTCCLLLALSSFSFMIQPYFAGYVIDLMDRNGVNAQTGEVCLYVLTIGFALQILGCIAANYSAYKMSIIAELIADSMRRKIVSHSIPESTNLMTFQRDIPLGKLTAHIGNDVDIVWDLFGFAIGEMFSAITTITIMSFIILALDLYIGLAFILLIIFFIYFYIKHGLKVRIIFTKIGKYYERMIGAPAEYYQSKNSIIAYRCKSWIEKNFAAKSNLIQTHMKRAHKRVVVFNFCTSSSFIMINIMLWWYCMPILFGLSWGQQFSMGKFVTLLLYTAMLQAPLSTISNCSKVFYRAQTALERIDQFLTDNTLRQLDLEELNSGKHLHTTDLIPLKRLNLSHVSAYSESGQPLLQDISFCIEGGECFGITGLSGSGKSTLVKIIARLMPFKDGKITIDDILLQKINEDMLRKLLVYVDQHPFYLRESVYDNMLLGSGEIDCNDVNLALSNVGLLERVHKLINNLHYKGVNIFSGGERQRFSLARAYTRTNAQFYILDEPTSALDEENQRKIRRYIRELKKLGKTIIVVTHSDIILQEMDRILLMDKGKSSLFPSYMKYSNFRNKQKEKVDVR